MPTHSDFETISHLIRSRRTVKPANMDPNRDIPRKSLLKLFENATWAPTHGMTEPWFFQIYEGASRSQLAQKLQSLYSELTPAEQFRADKFEKLGKNPLLAPVVVMIWMRRQQIEKIPEIEEIEAVACAVQNLHLSCSAAGLGGFWSSPPVLYNPTANGAFGMGEKDRALGLFYLGWPKPDSTNPEPTRTPVAQKISWMSES